MKTTFAYTAGYIDGDGCFYIGKQINPVKYISTITVSSTNKLVLEDFTSLYGGTVSLINKNAKHKNWKPTYHYRCGKTDSINLIEKIMPYLVERREHAKLFLEFINEPSKSKKQLFIKKMKDLKTNANRVNKQSFEDIVNYDTVVDCSIEDYAYLSGFIDAECTLGISKYKPKNRPNFVYKVTLAFNDSRTPVFYWLKERFGGSFTFVKGINRNDHIIWRISQKKLGNILPHFLPYLRYKKPVCEKLIEFYNTTFPNGGDRHSASFKEAYANVISIRESIVDCVHSLNLRGVNHI